MGKIVELLDEKNRVIRKLEELLDRESISRASEDSHSLRRPRPCGITIHTGIGCSVLCSYCYIYDMGFPAKVKPYPLTDLELVYALSRNPYVVPRRTLAAYGSVTEPFLPEVRRNAVSYISSVYRWLGLPSQVSTKMVLDEELVRGLKEAEPNISILVTLITVEKASTLERFAPKPLERLEGLRTASRYSLSVYLFVRPVIPGVTDRELNTIIRLGAEYGAKGVVFGSLRITNSIVKRLEASGVNTREILLRAPRTPTSSSQISIKMGDLIKKAEKVAQDYGLRPFRAACMANIDSHNDYCYMCSLGPCGRRDRAYPADYSDIAEYLEVEGVKFKSISIGLDSVRITKLNSISRGWGGRRLEIVRTVLSYALRRRVIIE